MKRLHAFVFSILIFLGSTPVWSKPEMKERKVPAWPYLIIQDEKLANYAKSVFTLLAPFVEHEEKATGHSNFIIIEKSDLVPDGKLNIEKMSEFHFPKDAVEQMARADIWRPGCGTFGFIDSEDKLYLTISAIDAALPAEKKRLCVEIAIGFGLGLPLPDDFPEQLMVPMILLYGPASDTCRGKEHFRNCVTVEIRRMLADMGKITGTDDGK
jgi:hypothetical protein